MKAIDITHIQIVNISVLLVELISLNVKTKAENAVEREERAKTLLAMASSVLKWVH